MNILSNLLTGTRGDEPMKPIGNLSTWNVLDGPACVRACSLGFTILAVGGLAQFLVARLFPPIAPFWLVAVSVFAYSFAGLRIGKSSNPALQGVAAACGSWALILPMRTFATGLAYVPQILLDLGIAMVVGGSAGFVAGHFKKRARRD